MTLTPVEKNDWNDLAELIKWSKAEDQSKILSSIKKYKDMGEKGLEILNHKDEDGKTFLMLAASNGSLNGFTITDALIKAGVDVNATDLEGNSAIIYASSRSPKQDDRARDRAQGLIELLIDNRATEPSFAKASSVKPHNKGLLKYISTCFKAEREVLKEFQEDLVNHQTGRTLKISDNGLYGALTPDQRTKLSERLNTEQVNPKLTDLKFWDKIKQVFTRKTDELIKQEKANKIIAKEIAKEIKTNSKNPYREQLDVVVKNKKEMQGNHSTQKASRQP